MAAGEQPSLVKCAMTDPCKSILYCDEQLNDSDDDDDAHDLTSAQHRPKRQKTTQVVQLPLAKLQDIPFLDAVHGSITAYTNRNISGRRVPRGFEMTLSGTPATRHFVGYRLLAKGSYGNVILCEDVNEVQTNKSQYVAKIMETFDAEICIGLLLDHVNILRYLHSIWDSMLSRYVIISLRMSTTLQDVFTDGKQTTLQHHEECRLIENVAIALLNALTYMNQNKLYHNDIKPSNTLIDWTGPDAVVKLCDFGSVSNKPMQGTTFYTAPEFATENKLKPDRILTLQWTPMKSSYIHNLHPFVTDVWGVALICTLVSAKCRTCLAECNETIVNERVWFMPNVNDIDLVKSRFSKESVYAKQVFEAGTKHYTKRKSAKDILMSLGLDVTSHLKNISMRAHCVPEPCSFKLHKM